MKTKEYIISAAVITAAFFSGSFATTLTSDDAAKIIEPVKIEMTITLEETAEEATTSGISKQVTSSATVSKTNKAATDKASKQSKKTEPTKQSEPEDFTAESDAPTLTLEEQLAAEGYVIVYERPKNDNEIYCRKGMSLEEWWEMNPPNDGAYDDWDDENNSPDII